MAGKPKGDKPKKARGPKPQPSKYDWDLLETEYVTGDIQGVAEFFRVRGIPQRTFYRRAKGWQEKRTAYHQKAHKMLRDGWLKESMKSLRDKLQINLQVSQGLMKVGVDSMIPSGYDKQGNPIGGMKPKSAGEASKIIELATRIEKNTLATMAILEGALKDTPTLPSGEDDEDGQPKANVVIIDIPANGKEAKELPGK